MNVTFSFNQKIMSCRRPFKIDYMVHGKRILQIIDMPNRSCAWECIVWCLASKQHLHPTLKAIKTKQVNHDKGNFEADQD